MCMMLCAHDPVPCAPCSVHTYTACACAPRPTQAPGSSWLGPCFCPSALDDPLVDSKPRVSGRAMPCKL